MLREEGVTTSFEAVDVENLRVSYAEGERGHNKFPPL